MRILVTGSSGRIGHYMVEELRKDHELVLFDLHPPKEPLPEGTAFIQGDLVDAEASRRAVQDVAAIVHLGAIGSSHVPHCYERNTQGTWNLLSAAAKAGVKRIAFSSTINVYGQGGYKVGTRIYDPPYLPIDENTPPRPEDSYGLSKLANEQAMRGFSDAYGISTYCFRLSGVWWPRNTQQHRPGPVGGPWVPSPRRAIDPWHYIDVRDVVSAFRKFIEMPDAPQFGLSYLVADDTTVNEPTMALLEKYIPHWVPLAGDRLPGNSAWFSNRRAKADLGWSPQFSWRDKLSAATPVTVLQPERR